jgi:hypothetical protein
LRRILLTIASVAAVLVFLDGCRSYGPAAPPANCSPPEVDLLGYSDALDEQRWEGAKVGGLSELAYDAERSLYYALPDSRGPAGSLEDIPTRLYTLSVPLEQGRLTEPTVLDATILRDPRGDPFTGANFDGKAIVLTSEEELLVTSEIEPSIRRFSLEGKFAGELPVPQKFLVAPEGYARDNQTFESLALSPNGRTLFTANEYAISTDVANSFPKRLLERLLGHARERVRILRNEDRGSSSFEPSEEFFYRTEWGGNLSGIVALSESKLLVLEARGRRIFQVSLDGAEDVSDEENLAATNATPLEKELLVDVGEDCPLPSRDKDSFGLLEGISLGPKLPDGRQTLLVVSDDGYSASEKTRMIMLGIRLRDRAIGS